MSSLKRRLHRIESCPRGHEPARELLSEQDWIIFHKIAKGELAENPELVHVTEADTDPATWRHILQTFVYARFPTRPDQDISIPEVIGALKCGAVEADEVKPTPWQALPKQLALGERIEMALAAARKRIDAQSPSA